MFEKGEKYPNFGTKLFEMCIITLHNSNLANHGIPRIGLVFQKVIQSELIKQSTPKQVKVD